MAKNPFHHKILFLLALPLTFPAGIAAVECGLVGAGVWSWAWILGLFLVLAGLLSLPLRPSRRPPLGRIGLGVLALTLAVHLGARAEEGPVVMRTLPADEPARLPAWLVKERDLVLAGADVLGRAGALLPGEEGGLVEALDQAYEELEDSFGVFPSPVLASYAGMQAVSAFDTLVVRPDNPQPKVGILFLHGFAGNFAWPCLFFAQQALAVDALTACPSVGPEGDWWSAQGEKTARETLSWLRAQGVERIYLAGLSNGAVGATALAPRLRDELAGVILISGARSGGNTAGLPTLLLQGSHDQRVATSRMRSFAAAQGASTTYRELEGDHFVYLHRRQEAGAIIQQWLRGQEE